MNYKQIVSDAAKWLDGVEPGWWRRIDRGSLDIGNPKRCVLCQLYNTFLLGLDLVDKSPSRNKIIYAFGGRFDDDLGYDLRTALWLAEIESRFARDKRQSESRADRFIERTRELINEMVEVEG